MLRSRRQLLEGHCCLVVDGLDPFGRGLKDQRRRPEGVNESQSKFLYETRPMPQVQTPKLKPYKKVMNTPTNSIEMIPSKL
jgi:hypothetical protein